MDITGDLAFFQTMGTTAWIISVVIYLCAAYCLQRIAGKTQTPHGWMAYIPVLNLYLMCKIAGKPVWWIILMFIPIVNIVILILVYMAIAKAVGKPEWTGILQIIPVVNLVILSWWAFSKQTNTVNA